LEAVLLVGIQGAGKTTFCQERFADTHARISLDTLGTREREWVVVTECLKAGRAFVIDNTNARASERAKYITPAKAAGFRVTAYYFKTPLRAAIARNNRRKPGEKVPVPALIATFKRLEIPKIEEGFDQIFTVELNAENQFMVAEQPPV